MSPAWVQRSSAVVDLHFQNPSKVAISAFSKVDEALGCFNNYGRLLRRW
jgi:hypothetical protein